MTKWPEHWPETCEMAFLATEPRPFITSWLSLLLLTLFSLFLSADNDLIYNCDMRSRQENGWIRQASMLSRAPLPLPYKLALIVRTEGGSDWENTPKEKANVRARVQA